MIVQVANCRLHVLSQLHWQLTATSIYRSNVRCSLCDQSAETHFTRNGLIQTATITLSCLPTLLHKVALRVSVLHPNSAHAPEDSETE